LAQVEKAKSNQTSLSNMSAERKALVDELNQTQARIKTLEAARDRAETQAERDALSAEINQLAKQAEVTYKKIQDLDKKMDALNSDQTKLLTDINRNWEKINLEQIAEKTTGQPVSSGTTAAKSATPGNTSGSAGNTSSGTSAGQPLPKAAAYPVTLTQNYFSTTGSAGHSNSNPIPIDPQLPDGLVFKVQIGAFRNAVANDQFGSISPIAGETLPNGLTRYTAGLFMDFTSADQAKAQIRSMGYSDAFVVAYLNGKRIPIYEALGRGTPAATAATAPAAPVTSNVTPTAQGAPREMAATNPSGYYESFSGVAKADVVNDITGLFYTVQVGVYSRPAPLSKIYNLSPLNSDVLSDGKIRYSTGRYDSVEDAIVRRDQVKNLGVSDAFVTAYYQGKRITIEEARKLEASAPSGAAQMPGSRPSTPTATGGRFEVLIGAFEDRVPDEVVRAILELEDELGIITTREGGKKVYKTRSYTSRQQAEQALKKLENAEVSGAIIRAAAE
jgi:hypothetical protein